MIHATIDGIAVEVEEGSTILQAAQSVNIRIPTLCYIKDLVPEGSCRMCMVEIVGMPKLVTACSFPIAEGNEILTHSERVVEARKGILDLLLSNHPNECFSCPGNGDCEFQALCYEYGVTETSYPGEIEKKPIDDTNPYFTYNPNLCILCHRCVNTCSQIVGRSAISTIHRGFKSRIGMPFDKPWIDNTECEFCGNCVQACPVGALRTKNRAKYRPWEVTRVLATCHNCCRGPENGCERYLLIKNGEIVDVVAKSDSPNRGHGTICNKGRFEFYNAEAPSQIMELKQKDVEKYRAALMKDLGLKG